MRGKPSAAKTHGVYTGITPADAGKTDPGAWMRYQGVGSPPRMRGKLFLLSTSCCAFGITPADAGKTYRREMKKKELRDHPRGCGENFLQSHIQNVRTGSPPRMRGKLHIRACVFYSVGITPADAGKTLQRAYAVKSVRDHPRGCGENPCGLDRTNIAHGSPPRMRGKLGRPPKEINQTRITPADAGKTFKIG